MQYEIKLYSQFGLLVAEIEMPGILTVGGLMEWRESVVSHSPERCSLTIKRVVAKSATSEDKNGK